MGKNIVKAKEYKVKDGDTVESIASLNGISLSQLATFNWGVDTPEGINLALRDKVGARKKAEDKKSFILSGEDDPGIIYIPETTAPKGFAADAEHTITVKTPGKVYKPAYTTVCFRPKDGWKGESYGFDWFRAADFKVGGFFDTLDFNTDIFGKLYVPVGGAAATQTLQQDGNSYTGDFRADAAMLTKAKTDEYKVVKVKDSSGKDVELFAAHINIYINGSDLKPPQTVELQAFVNNSEEVLDELIFEVQDADSEFVKITTTANLKKLAIKDDEKIPLKLECLKEIPREITVLAKAVTRNVDGSYLEKQAGKLIIYPNAAAHRKHIKILLIEVNTPEIATGGGAVAPDMTNQEELFRKLLRQALVNPVIQKPNIVLDLSADDYFKTHFITGTGASRKILSYKWGASGPVKFDGKYNYIQDYLDTVLKKQLTDAGSPIATKLDDYIKAYYFGDRGKSESSGVSSDLNGYSLNKYVVMFKNRNEGTSPHEFLHSLGLPHTFDTGAKTTGVSANAKFSYKYAQTDNIMDYTHHRSGYENSRVATFHWQWGIANKHAYAKPNDE